MGDTERRRLIELGLPMADASDWQTAEERFYAYTALAAPSHRLFVTYAASIKGETLTPSALVDTVRQVLPGLLLSAAGGSRGMGCGIRRRRL